MGDRVFQFSTRQDGRGYVVVCRHCKAEEAVHCATSSGTLPPPVVARKFAQKGWEIGRNDAHDVCPKCLAGMKGAKRAVVKDSPGAVGKLTARMAAEPGDIKLVPTLEIVPPRVMQKDDRRLIFDRINDVYLDEDKGYADGWNDAKLAKDLGVPTAWVAQIRDENFGSEFNKDELAEVRDELTAEIARLKAFMSEANAIVEQFKRLAPIADKLAAMVSEATTRSAALERLLVTARRRLGVADAA